jgi:hypothetical protein
MTRVEEVLAKEEPKSIGFRGPQFANWDLGLAQLRKKAGVKITILEVKGSKAALMG